VFLVCQLFLARTIPRPPCHVRVFLASAPRPDRCSEVAGYLLVIMQVVLAGQMVRWCWSKSIASMVDPAQTAHLRASSLSWLMAMVTSSTLGVEGTPIMRQGGAAGVCKGLLKPTAFSRAKRGAA